MVAGITFFIIFLIRIIPVVLIAIFSDKGFVDTGHADPLLYFGGAQAILETGVNPFPFFPPLNFLFIAACLYLGHGSPLVPITAIAVVGWLTVVGIYLFTKELFGNEKTALIAAIISGMYPEFIFFGISFYSETLAIFLIVICFLMILKYFKTRKIYFLVLSGMLWGLASLTRGGLHFFSGFIGIVMMMNCYGRGWRARMQPVAVFLLATYLTIFSVSRMVLPIQGESSLNSKSGIGSLIHGANRITTSCSDYGDIRGNIFYEINNCQEKWPPGSQLYSDELMKADTFTILRKFTAFVLHAPVTYVKNSCLKLSCFFSPNQLVMFFLKTKFDYMNNLIIGGLCLVISLFYIIVICGGLWGIFSAKDSFRPVFISFILFYCALIFITVGNSKLRLPLLPFFSIYCAYFLSHVKDGMWRKAVFHKWNIILVLLFLCNSIYKYPELLLSPAEIHVQKIELCNQLGFPKTALYLIEHPKKKFAYSAIEKERLSRAEAAVRKKILEPPDAK